MFGYCSFPDEQSTTSTLLSKESSLREVCEGFCFVRLWVLHSTWLEILWKRESHRLNTRAEVHEYIRLAASEQHPESAKSVLRVASNIVYRL